MADDPKDAVLEFYTTHPISEDQILDKLRSDGVDIDRLSQDLLQDYDQDHYGGLAANDTLGDWAGIDADTHVLDLCCGLGGPARYFAAKHGCTVIGVDLTESRVSGARNLTDLTDLSHRVRFECADARDLPFEDATFDIAISQEAFGHIPDKDRLIAECARVLKPGGRLAFTDILATPRTRAVTHRRLAEDMAFHQLSTQQDYIDRLGAAGCEVTRTEDLGEAWRGILIDRLGMYRHLGNQTIARFGQAHYDRWDRAYSFFVSQFSTGELSGGRFLARRNDD